MQRVMSISNSFGRFFDLRPFVVGGDFGGGDFDGLGRADEFTELAGDAAFAALFVGDEGGGTAVVFGELLVPALFGELHGDAESGRGERVPAEGPATKRFNGMAHGEKEAFDEGAEVDFLTEVEFRAFELDDSHFGIERVR